MVGCRRRSELVVQGGLLLYPPKNRSEYLRSQPLCNTFQPIGSHLWKKGGNMVGINTGSELLKWIVGENIDYIVPDKARGLISCVREFGLNHGAIIG